VPQTRHFRAKAHWNIQTVLDEWCYMEGQTNEELMFTCNGRIFHHSLCAAEMLINLNIQVPALVINVSQTGLKMTDELWDLARDAELRLADCYEPLIHP
jgi:hypothetical protein